MQLRIVKMKTPPYDLPVYMIEKKGMFKWKLLTKERFNTYDSARCYIARYIMVEGVKVNVCN